MTMSRNSQGEWTTRLKVRETFESFEEMQSFIVQHGVQCERVITTYKKDSKRCLSYCKMNNLSIEVSRRCPWRIRAIKRKKSKIITITKACLTHTCEAADHWKRRMHTNSNHVAKQIFEIVMKNRQTTPSSLRDTAQALIHPDIQYHTAYAAKKKALEKLDRKEKDSFFLIPDHCNHILQRDPGATAKYSAPNGRFESLFVSPSATREAYKHCRPLVAFDGTHTRSAYPQILLIATALDANNDVLMLAYCMVPTENPTEWLRFLTLIRDAIPELDRPGTVFISDPEKGLLDGVEEIFPAGFHAICSRHLGDNCRTKFNKAAQKQFESLVYATTPEHYQRRFDRIKEKNKELAEYIQGTADPVRYSRAYCPVKRWGHETSQHAESLNRALKPQRMEVAFKQSNLLWDYVMTKFFDKRNQAEATATPFPPTIMGILKETEAKATLLIADASSDSECQVTDSLGRQFLVQFEAEWKCTCGDWQDIMLPCIHAWRACTRLQKRHYDHVSPYYSTTTYRQTYAPVVPAILVDDLVPNPSCGVPPVVKRKRGRPSEKTRARFQDEDPVRRPRRCGHCKEAGHNRRKCPIRHVLLSQGTGPTVESEDEETDKGAALVEAYAAYELYSTSDSEPDEEFTIDAVNERKANYVSDNEDLDETQEVIDLGSTRTPRELFVSQVASQGGYYSSLLASMISNK